MIETLNGNLVRFTRSSDKYSKKLVYLTWVLVGLTVIVVVLTLMLIKGAREQTSSQNSIALNGQFFASTNTRIINTMEDGRQILVEHGGRFTPAQLDNYLGTFDTIDNQYEKRLLSESDLCGSFSYYIDLTNKNSEVRAYIADQQKVDEGFFASFDELVDVISESKNVNCH